ncbi:hypothetical protein H7X87_01315 [Acetobacteraceae bacterium]|nr:hypothetical protein [Candidatus Parcubacteria bacterium]
MQWLRMFTVALYLSVGTAYAANEFVDEIPYRGGIDWRLLSLENIDLFLFLAQEPLEIPSNVTSYIAQGWEFPLMPIIPRQLFLEEIFEFPNTTMWYVGLSGKRKGMTFVSYNPTQCMRQGPDVCRFVRFHEYGHLAREMPPYDWEDPLREANADCWAAEHADVEAVAASIQYFIWIGSTDMPGYGTGFEQAQRVIDAATTGECHW